MGMDINLVSLPFELQLAIFSYLDVSSVLGLSSLSHDFSNLAMCDAFYQTILERECLILKKYPSLSKSDFLGYLQQHLGHASWKQLYKVLVVLPHLERRFLSLLDLNILWKPHDEEAIHSLPRLVRLERCIWVLCSSNYASSSIQALEEAFVLGHHCFATLPQFFVLLIIKYCVPIYESEDPSRVDPALVELIRSRVATMIHMWVSKNDHDILLNPSLCTSIRQFVDCIMAPQHKKEMINTLSIISSDHISSHSARFAETFGFMSSFGPNDRTDSESTTSISNFSRDSTPLVSGENDFGFRALTIGGRVEEEDEEEESNNVSKKNINEINVGNLSPFGSAGTLRIPPMFSSSLSSHSLTILDCDVNVVAQELAWFDWELYSRVQICEIMDKSWRHADKLTFSPNIVASIRWFNHLSFWVATEVLNYQKVAHRTQALSAFMHVATKCYELRDYHSVFSILAGLNMACIQRLHNSWLGMSTKLRESFKRMSSFITGVNGDFLAYKNTIKNCPLPAVPYLGCLLYDITFVLDTSENPKFPLIHLHKVSVISKIVHEVTRFQRVAYSVPPTLKYLGQLRNVKVLDAAELYKRALELEPRKK